RPKVLVAQARRMLRHERVRALATEFGGNWLDFRRFEEHNAVDRDRFPSFNNELRQAMFEEPIRFFVDVVRENRSVLDFLYADYTFVNPILAKHYGMSEVLPLPRGGEGWGEGARGPDAWAGDDKAHPYERGGLRTRSVLPTD